MTTITSHFTEEFNSEVYHALQNKGGFYRTRVRRKTGVVGLKTHFPKIGAAPSAQPKTRKGDVPTMDIARTRVYATLEDKFGADYVDDLDELKTNVAERQAIQTAIVNSLNRAEDDVAQNILITSANANNSVGAADAISNDTIPQTVLEQFGAAEALEGGNMHAAVTWSTWADLLALNSFVNSEVGGDPALTSEGVKPKMFYGFAYAPHSRAATHSSGRKENLWWNARCVGVAVGKEITPSTDWITEKDSWFIKAKMSMGGVMIDDTGVIRRHYAA